MKYTFLFDFSRVLVFPKDKKYSGDLNPLYAKEASNKALNFDDYFIFNNELIKYLRYLASTNEIYMFTSGLMQDDRVAQRKLEGIFRGIFSAEKMGMRKADFTAYIKVARTMGKSLPEIVFIDDNSANLKAALEAGMKTIHYTDNKKLLKELENFLEN